jgi:hypothetical protein
VAGFTKSSRKTAEIIEFYGSSNDVIDKHGNLLNDIAHE